MAFTPTLRRTILILVSLATALTVAVGPGEAANQRPIAAAPQPDAAAGVVGYGAKTAGGAGGRVIWVTNRNDSGAGSLRAALMASGRRIVRFRIAGTIVLQSRIKIRNPFITVAGNMARGEGVQLRGHPIIVVTHDVILRHLRIRLGDALLSSAEAKDADPLTLNGVEKNTYNIVLDHMSLLWGTDIGGLAILGNVHDVTVQNSIIGEGLYLSRQPSSHDGDGNSMGMNVTPMVPGQTPPTRLTFYRNLFTTSDLRMPRLMGAVCADMVNNVIYNWGIHAAMGNPRSLNIVANWFRRGPRMKTSDYWLPSAGSVAPSLFHTSVFTRSNRMDGFSGHRHANGVVYAASARCGGLSVHASPVPTVLNSVLTNVGAKLPVRDAIDRRVIFNVRNRVGRYFNGVGYAAPHPYWPTLSPFLP